MNIQVPLLLTPCTWAASADRRAHNAPVELARFSKNTASCCKICVNMRRRSRSVSRVPATPKDTVWKRHIYIPHQLLILSLIYMLYLLIRSRSFVAKQSFRILYLGSWILILFDFYILSFSIYKFMYIADLRLLGVHIQEYFLFYSITFPSIITF